MSYYTAVVFILVELNAHMYSVALLYFLWELKQNFEKIIRGTFFDDRFGSCCQKRYAIRTMIYFMNGQHFL